MTAVTVKTLLYLYNNGLFCRTGRRSSINLNDSYIIPNFHRLPTSALNCEENLSLEFVRIDLFVNYKLKLSRSFWFHSTLNCYYSKRSDGNYLAMLRRKTDFSIPQRKKCSTFTPFLQLLETIQVGFEKKRKR